MKSRQLKALLMLAFAAPILFNACKKDKEPFDVNTGDKISFEVPEGWPQPVYQFETNPLTQKGFELGRKLFFEPLLSKTNTISCGTCHQPFSAFAQLDHDFSHGIFDLLGERNSPPIFNLSWHSSFFWDGGVNHIEVQPFAPIQNPVEMGEQLEAIIKKLEQHDEYPQLFAAAFGSEGITTQRMGWAFAQFMGALVSNHSKYDKVKRNEAGVQFTTQEEAGYTIFKNKCASCHTEPLFSNFSFENNGLALIPTHTGKIDSGRGHITPFDPSSWFKFKVPSLRNLKYTFPYMHDGRYKTLDQVLEHYTSGIQQTPNLAPQLANGIALNQTEKDALKAFLNTLNDETFVKDQRFQQPR